MNTIIEVHAASYGTYGHRRVRAELVLGQQVEVSHGRVERLMRWTGPQELNAQLSSHDQLVGVAIERAEGILVEDLQGHGHRLFCVSPKMSALARERYRMAPTKSDSFDAFVLADMLVPRCSLISTTSVVSNTVFVPPVNNPPVRRGSPPPIGSV